jgi:hypothetical protein
MRTFPTLIVIGIMLFSCKQKHEASGHHAHHEHHSYSPGLGDYMLAMQTRHAKLWFAGINENWELAEFQLHEMEEIIEDIEKFKAEEEEVKLLPMIQAPLDSVDTAVEAKDPDRFRSTYENLTATCNSCHVASKHAYNMVKVPDGPMFTNQEFKSRD